MEMLEAIEIDQTYVIAFSLVRFILAENNTTRGPAISILGSRALQLPYETEPIILL